MDSREKMYSKSFAAEAGKNLKNQDYRCLLGVMLEGLQLLVCGRLID